MTREDALEILRRLGHGRAKLALLKRRQTELKLEVDTLEAKLTKLESSAADAAAFLEHKVELSLP